MDKNGFIELATVMLDKSHSRGIRVIFFEDGKRYEVEIRREIYETRPGEDEGVVFEH